METYISILRGINVGGHKLIKMAALTKLYEDLGFTKVKTYIQSGNVVFQSKQTDDLKESLISEKITEVFSFEVPVIVMKIKDIDVVFKNNPFILKKKYDVSFLHVTFFSQQPKQVDIDKISGVFGNDEFAFFEKAVYLYCPDSYSKSKLTNSFFENKLKVSATTRNWKTTAELVFIASSL
jgi:uncharacterized protein (DUF1697 family)